MRKISATTTGGAFIRSIAPLTKSERARHDGSKDLQSDSFANKTLAELQAKLERIERRESGYRSRLSAIDTLTLLTANDTGTPVSKDEQSSNATKSYTSVKSFSTEQ